MFKKKKEETKKLIEQLPELPTTSQMEDKIREIIEVLNK